MATITLPERDLEARRNSLHSVFAPLRKNRPRVAIGRASDSPGGAIAIVATDEKSGILRYRGERFRTSVSILRCSYFELWRGTASGKLTLNRAYFTLLKVIPEATGFAELLCVHTDPSDADDLKQGPHLHVSCAPDPIQHCHFPLEFGFLSVVLKDVASLTSAMARSIAVITRDLLPQFKD